MKYFHQRAIGYLIILFTICSSTVAAEKTYDDIDKRTIEHIFLFMEACVFGEPDRQGRISTMDTHMHLKRVPIPPESQAAKSGRLIWVSEKGALYILDTNMRCTTIIDDEEIKSKLDQYIVQAKLGASGNDGKKAKFTKTTLDSSVIAKYQAKNIEINRYVYRYPDSDIGILLVTETTITESDSQEPVKIWGIIPKIR